MPYLLKVEKILSSKFIEEYKYRSLDDPKNGISYVWNSFRTRINMIFAGEFGIKYEVALAKVQDGKAICWLEFNFGSKQIVEAKLKEFFDYVTDDF